MPKILIQQRQRNLIPVLILAGGKSSRMGQDKALMLYRDVPMLQRVYEVATACSSEVYVLTPWKERYQQILPGNCRYLREQQPGTGPMVGLQQGLTEITADWVFLLACDLPLLNAEIIQNWMAQLERVPSNIMAVVPQQSGYWEPLCAFYRSHVRDDLANFLQASPQKHSFQNWLNSIPVQPLPVDARIKIMLHNCNTPLDVE
jgi:molybdopterin-guanine dinucleotide biosynthesis protein A